MAVEARLSEDEILLGLLALHPVFFAEYFWKDQLSKPMSTKQKMMFADTSQYQICCTARKVAKTIKVESRIIQYAIANADYADREGIFCTPGEAQLLPVVDRVVRRLHNVKLFEMLSERMNRQSGIMSFKTGFRWFCRIDGTDNTGRNYIGLRAVVILGDEQAYGTNGAHAERIQSALPHALWDYNGVPNGVRSSAFYRIDQTEEGRKWSHHHLESFDNPIYQPKDKFYKEVADNYGGRNNPDFIRQALGQWGDEAFGAFSREHMTFQEDLPYFVQEFRQREIESAINQGNLYTLLRLPRPKNVSRWVIGSDIGIISDPTVIKMAYEVDGIWYDACRITLRNIGQPIYVSYIICKLIELANAPVVKICIDTANYGKAVVDFFIGPAALPQFQGITNWAAVLISADAGGQTQIEDPTDPDHRQFVTNKHYNTMTLKRMMANSTFVYPGIKLESGEYDGVDNVQLTELLTTTEERTSAGNIVYKPARRGDEHITDALRGVAKAIEEADTSMYVDTTINEIGWTGVGAYWDEQGNWENPWQGSISAIEE